MEIVARPVEFRILLEGISEPGLVENFERRKGMKCLLHTLASDLAEDFKLRD